MRDFFKRVRDAGSEVKTIKRQQERYRDIATSLGANLSGMPSYRQQTSKVESAAVELADLEQRLGDAALELTGLLAKAQAIIDAMPTRRYRQLLTERYINLCSWQEVTRRLGYEDDKSVFRALGEAIREAENSICR